MSNYLPPVSIELPDDTQPSSKLIEYCLNRSANEFRRLNRLRRYYLTDNDIRRAMLGNPDFPYLRIAHAFPRYISKIATAFFMGKGLRYQTKDDVFQSYLDEIRNDTYADTQNYEAAKEMSISGVAYELQYLNPEGRYKSKVLKANEVIPIFSAGIDHFLHMAVRFYAANSLDGSAVRWAEVYTNSEVVTYCLTGGGWRETQRRNHLLGSVPVILRRNNEERKGDFEDVIPQIDAYDRAQSDTMNDLDYFSDAYLKMTGVDEMVEEVPEEENGARILKQRDSKCMKYKRMLCFPEGGDAEFLQKDTNDTATENFKSRLYRDIFFLSQVPNLTDESFAGNLSGIAMKYKLYGLSELSEEKEKYWISAERKKIQMMTQYINLRHLSNYDWHDVEISFDRSAFANSLEISQEMNNLRELLSKRTIIGLYPGIADPDEELQQMRKEQAAEGSGVEPPEGGVY